MSLKENMKAAPGAAAAPAPAPTAAPQNQVQAQPQGKLQSLKGLIDTMMPAIQKALPKHLTPDRMGRIILTEFHKNPLLLECTRESVIGSILTCSQMGLEVGSTLGEAYLVPFKISKKVNGGWQYHYECTLIPGYQGFIKLARNTGELKTIVAAVVRQGDHFVWKRSLDGDTFEHEERYESEEFTHCYAFATFKNGGHAIVVWPWKKVIQHALKHSKEKDKDTKEKILPKMWLDNQESMGCKTMIRQLWKFLPRSPEMNQVFEADGQIIHANHQGEFMPLLPPTEDPQDPQDENPGENIDTLTGEVTTNQE